MNKGKQLYEGKAKIIYATDDPNLVIMYFKDDATAFNAQKKGTIVNKGVMNNAISSAVFKRLEEDGVKTHFVEKLNDREMLCKKLDIIMVEVIQRNYIAGSMAKRLGLEEGVKLDAPIMEYSYKSDALGDPLFNRDHIRAMKLATDTEMETLNRSAKKVNQFLIKFFDRLGIIFVDFKLEFGRFNGEVLLGDEITPDGCRLWDKTTMEKLDKDRFRHNLGKVEEAYQKIYDLVCES